MASDTYGLFVAAVEEFLKSSKSVGPLSSKSNKQIVEGVRSRIASGELQIDLTDGSMLSYLSYAANDDVDSRIVSGGPRRGYWIDTSEKQEPEQKPVDEQIVEQGKNKEKISEKDLYPLTELWLESKGYTAKDMSNLKAGGKWGNPDIIGVDRVELFGAVEMEISSCEVKLSDAAWEQMIFEAISHKRFSNRSWFCYRVAGEAAPLPKGMEAYAERYRIGVVQIILSDKEVVDLKASKAEPLDFLDRMVERVPAPYDPVSLREKRDLIDRTGVTISVSF